MLAHVLWRSGLQSPFRYQFTGHLNDPSLCFLTCKIKTSDRAVSTVSFISRMDLWVLDKQGVGVVWFYRQACPRAWVVRGLMLSGVLSWGGRGGAELWKGARWVTEESWRWDHSKDTNHRCGGWKVSFSAWNIPELRLKVSKRGEGVSCWYTLKSWMFMIWFFIITWALCLRTRYRGKSYGTHLTFSIPCLAYEELLAFFCAWNRHRSSSIGLLWWGWRSAHMPSDSKIPVIPPHHVHGPEF